MDLEVAADTSSPASQPIWESVNVTSLVLRGVVVLLILVASLFVWRFARAAVVQPFDSLVTEQACRGHGEDIGRPLIDYERSNRFGLSNRTVGYCLLGPVDGGQGSVQLRLDEIEFGPLYRLAKAAGIITQLAIVSFFLRLAVDPAMDLYRIVLRFIERRQV